MNTIDLLRQSIAYAEEYLRGVPSSRADLGPLSWMYSEKSIAFAKAQLEHDRERLALLLPGPPVKTCRACQEPSRKVTNGLCPRCHGERQALERFERDYNSKNPS